MSYRRPALLLLVSAAIAYGGIRPEAAEASDGAVKVAPAQTFGGPLPGTDPGTLPFLLAGLGLMAFGGRSTFKKD